MTLTEDDRRLWDTLPKDPHVLDIARRVHPTWLSAHGHKDDFGVEHLAQEIGQCVAALMAKPDQQVASGGGIQVIGIQHGSFKQFMVCVIAGTVVDMRMGHAPS